MKNCLCKSFCDYAFFSSKSHNFARSGVYLGCKKHSNIPFPSRCEDLWIGLQCKQRLDCLSEKGKKWRRTSFEVWKKGKEYKLNLCKQVSKHDKKIRSTGPMSYIGKACHKKDSSHMILYIPHICHFLYTNAFSRPVKSTPKKCVNSRQKLLRDKTA